MANGSRLSLVQRGGYALLAGPLFIRLRMNAHKNLRMNELVDDAHRETELPRNGPVRAPRGPQTHRSLPIRCGGHLPPAPRSAALNARTVTAGRGPCFEALRAAGRLPIRQPREEEKEELPPLRGRPRGKEGVLGAVVADAAGPVRG